MTALFVTAFLLSNSELLFDGSLAQTFEGVHKVPAVFKLIMFAYQFKTIHSYAVCVVCTRHGLFDNMVMVLG